MPTRLFAATSGHAPVVDPCADQSVPSVPCDLGLSALPILVAVGRFLAMCSTSLRLLLIGRVALPLVSSSDSRGVAPRRGPRTRHAGPCRRSRNTRQDEARVRPAPGVSFVVDFRRNQPKQSVCNQLHFAVNGQHPSSISLRPWRSSASTSPDLSRLRGQTLPSYLALPDPFLLPPTAHTACEELSSSGLVAKHLSPVSSLSFADHLVCTCKMSTSATLDPSDKAGLAAGIPRVSSPLSHADLQSDFRGTPSPTPSSYRNRDGSGTDAARGLYRGGPSPSPSLSKRDILRSKHPQPRHVSKLENIIGKKEGSSKDHGEDVLSTDIGILSDEVYDEYLAAPVAWVRRWLVWSLRKETKLLAWHQVGHRDCGLLQSKAFAF